MKKILLKRILDIFFSALLLALASPIMLIVALLVRSQLGSPILFRQQRPGLMGQPFTIYKFRTMHNLYDSEGNLLEDAKRLSRLGRFLRKTSLDELPEVFNVLNGSMSLVGPRPLIMEYLEHYTPLQHRRHEIKPGITGLAQVSGRNAISWEKKFELDVWYVDHWTMSLDFKILLCTIYKVLKCEGVNAPGQVTISKFVSDRRWK
jgi:sugar transferase EpsL